MQEICVNTGGIEIGKISVTKSQIYQAGIREMLCILSPHFAEWSEKMVIQADPFYPQPHGNPTAPLESLSHKRRDLM